MLELSLGSLNAGSGLVRSEIQQVADSTLERKKRCEESEHQFLLDMATRVSIGRANTRDVAHVGNPWEHLGLGSELGSVEASKIASGTSDPGQIGRHLLGMSLLVGLRNSTREKNTRKVCRQVMRVS